MNKYQERNDCRVCFSRDLAKVLDFGDMPLAGGFIRPDEENHTYPLTVWFCRRCKAVQVREVIPAEVLFKDYRFVSSTTSTLSAHFRDYAQEISRRFLGPKSFVIEFGCNDGVLLKPLGELGIDALGFEPATNIAKIARDRGCNVVNDYFDTRSIEPILNSKGAADLICANNVFAHIDDIHEPLRAVSQILKRHGVFVFEVHYLMDLIQKCQYDMIYHEHMLHHSVRALEFLLDQFEMEIFEVKKVPTHAGSIRVYAQFCGFGVQSVSESVNQFLVDEQLKGLGLEETLLEFGKEVYANRDRLERTVRSLRAQNKTVVGYGASGRATVHLNLSHLDSDLVPFVVDASAERQGRLVPGVRTPIISPQQFRDRKADYALLFAYNYYDEVQRKEEKFLAAGGQFLFPIDGWNVSN